jgi:hypothetical protein
MLVALAVASPLGLAHGEPDPTYPGLPKQQNAQWFYSNGTALGKAEKQEQYFRIPPAGMLSDTVASRVPIDRTCTKHPPYTSVLDYDNRVFVVPPVNERTDVASWGRFPDVRVNTVAFGNIPVTVVVRITQLRDQEGLPVPFKVRQLDNRICSSATLPPEFREEYSGKISYIGSATVSGPVTVEVVEIDVDGLPVAVGSRCRTSLPIDMVLRGRGAFRLNAIQYADEATGEVIPAALMPPNRPTEYFITTQGGSLTGEIDIPPFTGCGVGAEDLSPLITSAVSGPGNPVEAFVGPLSTPETCPLLDCNFPELFEFPKRD